MGLIAALYEITSAELAALRKDPEALRGVLAGEGHTRRFANLDKAWDGLHFLFRAAGLDFEAELVDFERGVRQGDHVFIAVSAAVVSALAENFADPGREAQLEAHYDPVKMTGVYPSGAWDHESGRGYLLGFVDVLRGFLTEVARRRGSVVAVRG